MRVEKVPGVRTLSPPADASMVTFEAPCQNRLERQERSSDDLLCVFRSGELRLRIRLELDERLEDVAASDAERHELRLPNPDGANRHLAELFGNYFGTGEEEESEQNNQATAPGSDSLMKKPPSSAVPVTTKKRRG
jgi:hypothetical protein